ncbi:MAG: Veg family protein [Dethiobacteria bacterium]|nr:Veg family protein [Bacillota bacterium]NMD33954.1 Veg protein [Bacillota bacterium]HOB29622.1 Veg family protein [Bacillota bacterium]HPZ40912.1 Veg family protein [Bacillota bacterium]HQD52002.1 Veg family protein [Bacillota bacterium]
MSKDVLLEIRKRLEPHVGEKIRLKANRGRRRTFEKEGILESTYPSIFVVRIDEPNYFQRVSFTYADVLTETVELSFGEEKRRRSAGL